MKKTITVQALKSESFKEQKLTIGLDLGDRWSFYCVLDEAGQVILEQRLPTTPEAMASILTDTARSVALETGTHSPWVFTKLTELYHEVIVAHAQKVQWITKSNRKDDRHDARTLARLARIDPALLGPVRHRSAVKRQLHLTVIRARAELVSARTALINAARGLVKSYGQRLPKCGTPYQVSRGIHRCIEPRIAGCSGAVAQS